LAACGAPTLMIARLSSAIAAIIRSSRDMLHAILARLVGVESLSMPTFRAADFLPNPAFRAAATSAPCPGFSVT
jgi:hypothetical protein